MGKWKQKWWMLLLLLPALAAVILPARQEIGQARENRAQIEEMQSQLAAMGEEARKQQLNLAKWYNYNLELGTPGMEEVYGSILNLGNGVIAALEVPELDLHLPVFHGENGIAGHRPDSDFPIGGRGNHTVLKLKKWYPWEAGMTVYMACLGKRAAYRVESVQVMDSGWSTEWPSEQERLTILCDRGGKRTIIRCIRCGELNVQKSEEKLSICAAILLPGLIVLMKIPLNRIGKRKHRSFGSEKYTGFSRKNRRKSKLL